MHVLMWVESDRWSRYVLARAARGVARVTSRVAWCRVQSAGFRAQGSGCRVQGAGFRVQGSGCRAQGAGFI